MARSTITPGTRASKAHTALDRWTRSWFSSVAFGQLAASTQVLPGQVEHPRRHGLRSGSFAGRPLGLYPDLRRRHLDHLVRKWFGPERHEDGIQPGRLRQRCQ